MMEALLTAHSVFRWVVILVAVAALGIAWMSSAGSRPWDGTSDRLTMLFPIAMDIQVLIGLLVWIFGQHWTGDTFVGWIHPALMLAAVGLSHVGRARSERMPGAKEKARQALLFFGLALLVVLVAIPLNS
ncbi:MAG TPA: hypothetical protein VM409_02955, partial [Chloroflexia bacterium]|nr:hypothetical protein [Chloroflexia bacterium]